MPNTVDVPSVYLEEGGREGGREGRGRRARMGERVEVRGRQRNEKGRRERKEQGTKREGVVWMHNRKSGRGE